MSKSAQDLPVGRVGRVTSGDDAGFLVKVVDDTEATGGFYVLLWTTSEGFDDWLESWDGVVERMAGLTVEWLSDAEASSVAIATHRRDAPNP